MFCEKCGPKLPKCVNFGPKHEDFFVSRETLLFEKFEGADFKYDNNFWHTCFL